MDWVSEWSELEWMNECKNTCNILYGCSHTHTIRLWQRLNNNESEKYIFIAYPYIISFLPGILWKKNKNKKSYIAKKNNSETEVVEQQQQQQQTEQQPYV